MVTRRRARSLIEVVLSPVTLGLAVSPVTKCVPRPTSTLALTGIIGGAPPTVIANGKIVAIRDEIADGIALTSIHEMSIPVRDRSTTYDLALP